MQIQRKKKLRLAENRYHVAYFRLMEMFDSGDYDNALELALSTIESYKGEVAPSVLAQFYACVPVLVGKMDSPPDILYRVYRDIAVGTLDECYVRAAELGSVEIQQKLTAARIPWDRNLTKVETRLIEGVQPLWMMMMLFSAMAIVILAETLFNLPENTVYQLYLGIMCYGISRNCLLLYQIRKTISAGAYYRILTLIERMEEVWADMRILSVWLFVLFVFMFKNDIGWDSIAWAILIGCGLQLFFSAVGWVWKSLRVM